MASFIKKLLIGLIAVFLLGSVAVYITFKFVFSPNRLKKSFQLIATETLNRQVVIGSAQLKLGKLVLSNIEVDFKKENEKSEREYEKFIRCKKVEIKFELLPLIRKRFVFKEVKIEAPVLNLRYRPTINITELVRSKIQDSGIGRGVRFKINKLDIEKGKINFFIPDLPELKTKDFTFQIKGSSFGKPVKVSFSCKFNNSGFDKVNLLSSVDAFGANAIIEKLEIYGYEGKLDISGDIKKILTAPQFDLNYSFSEFPYGLIPERISITGQPSLKGNIKNEIGNLYINWNLDLSSCKLNYRDLYQKNEGSELKIQGGVTYKNADVSLNWYVIELHGATISGTGTINGDKVNINVRSESVDLKKLAQSLVFIKKYVDDGVLNIKGKVSGDKDSINLTAKINIKDIRVKNLEGLSDLYSKITGDKKTLFKVKNLDADILIDKEKLKINNLNLKGGDLEGWGKGYYRWGDEINFVVYPRFHGREIGLRIYGSSDSIKVGLK